MWGVGALARTGAGGRSQLRGSGDLQFYFLLPQTKAHLAGQVEKHCVRFRILGQGQIFLVKVNFFAWQHFFLSD